MKKLLLIIILSLMTAAATSAQKVVFMPHWLPQAQFAGYYVAQEKGFYAAEDLDVEIRHLSANTRKRPAAYLKSGEIDITTMMLINAMELEDSGTDVVNILQTAQSTGLVYVTRDAINDIKEMDNFKVGKWTTGYSEFAMMAADENNVAIQWIPLLNNINAFIAGAVDATLCYSFNEYVQLYLATGKDWSQNTIRLADIGFDYPDDGLYVTAEFYEKNNEVADKFAKASRKGWEWAAKHPDETVEICMEYIRRENISSNKIHQTMMLKEVLELLKDKNTGNASFARISRKVFDEMADRAINAGILFNKPDYDKMMKP